MIRHLGGDGQGQARLATAAGAGQRDQAMAGQQAANVGYLCLPSDKWSQIVGQTYPRSRLRRFHAQTLGNTALVVNEAGSYF
jgi:hypothetical protein